MKTANLLGCLNKPEQESLREIIEHMKEVNTLNFHLSQIGVKMEEDERAMAVV